MGRPLTDFWRDLEVGRKVVAPYLVLTLLIGVLVSAVASQQLAGAGARQLAALSLREQDNVNVVLNSVEERELTQLRVLAANAQLGPAIARGDRAALTALLLPEVASQQPEQVDVTAFDSGGQNLLEVTADPTQPNRCLCQAGGAPASAYEHVADVLAGRSDRYGALYVGLHSTGGGQLVYTVGPVAGPDGMPVGAILVGERLDQILASLSSTSHAELAFFDPQGAFLAGTSDLSVQVPQLDAAQRAAALTGTQTVAQSVSAGQRQEQIVYVPWMLRFEPRGYAAVIVPADPLAAAQGFLVPLIFGVCLAALLMTVLAGSLVARSITKPLADLLSSIDQVGQGHLDHRLKVTSGDEIGRLARAFNGMTHLLEQRTRRLERMSEDTLLSLAAAIDARDSYTHGHSLRVAAYSHALGAAAGLGTDELDLIRRGCLVHDIGKIGIPDRILRKVGPLDEEERFEMRQHPVIGRRLLSGLEWDRAVLDVVLHHHERWDGGGYPTGLAGDSIPLLARIVAVADALDAMTSDRPYRPALTYRRAARQVLEGAARQFDPALAEVFAGIQVEFGHLVASMAPPAPRRRPHRRAGSQAALRVIA